MPDPYYQDGGITLYHGDCRALLPTVAAPWDVALLLTDPPYGMNHEPTRRSDGSKRWGAERIAGDATPFDPAHLLAYPRLVLFGANWYAPQLPPSGGWIVWDKTPRGAKNGFTASHAELAWTNLSGSITKYCYQWGGEAHGVEPRLHPTQKPEALMEWLIGRYTEPGDLILDPYVGSGTTLRAAKNLGRRAVGIEIEERYCEVAAKRLGQGVLWAS